VAAPGAPSRRRVTARRVLPSVLGLSRSTAELRTVSCAAAAGHYEARFVRSLVLGARSRRSFPGLSQPARLNVPGSADPRLPRSHVIRMPLLQVVTSTAFSRKPLAPAHAYRLLSKGDVRRAFSLGTRLRTCRRGRPLSRSSSATGCRQVITPSCDAIGAFRRVAWSRPACRPCRRADTARVAPDVDEPSPFGHDEQAVGPLARASCYGLDLALDRSHRRRRCPWARSPPGPAVETASET